MIKLLLLTLMMQGMPNIEMKNIYQFSTNTSLKEWLVVNDGVMGGVSQSKLQLTDAGHGRFAGRVSLDNNGGFASIQLNKTVPLQTEKFVLLRVKGDGKDYEFRLKGKLSQYESYVHSFSTTGEWQIIRLAMKEFYPQFRGRRLDIPNFNFANIEQLCFLIANKKEENFELLIDWIAVE